jgi:hypothetical protein
LTSRAPSRSGRSPDLAYIDVEPILARLGGDLVDEIVLVGGQALNFWADRYAGLDASLGRAAPFTSKDIDFVGDRAAVTLCAERLGGELRLPTIDDVTPSTGIVRFVDGGGVEREIDFIDQPYGLRVEDVRRTALPVDFVDDARRATGIRFKILHPVLSMESRIHNVMGLPGYDSPHALNQARAAVTCARHFLRELLDVLGADAVRPVLKLNERIFRFATRDRHGRAAFERGLEPFDAVLVDERLPAAFRERRHPQMVTEVAATRARLGE